MSALRGYSGDRAELTPRMLAVLASAASGSTAAETARELGVTSSTVMTIRAAAMARLDARNVVAAVAIVVRRGDV